LLLFALKSKGNDATLLILLSPTSDATLLRALCLCVYTKAYRQCVCAVMRVRAWNESCVRMCVRTRVCAAQIDEMGLGVCDSVCVWDR